MTNENRSLLRLRDLFRGAMLGTLIGDALGMPVEGMSAEAISRHHGRVTEMLPARMGRGTYTDDTEMMIGLAEALLATAGRVDLDEIARRFGENYDSFRGYGQTTATILSVVRAGVPWRLAVSGNQLQGGSFGNGAAMRVAPVALAFFGSTAKVRQAARLQAEPTGHTHAEAMAGAELQAHAVHYALWRGWRGLALDGRRLIALLLAGAELPPVYHDKLVWIAEHLDAAPQQAIEHLGVSLRTSDSVPAALWSALSVGSFEQAVSRAVELGGDTDTIGAMAGAVAGAYFGASAIPQRWLDAVENSIKGRDYIAAMAERFCDTLRLPIELDEPQALAEDET